MVQKERLSMNPIVVKELRSRMRGARAFTILTAMLLVLGGALYGIYRLTMLGAAYNTMPGPIIGQTLFQSLAVLELLVICFITPALTSGTISSEKEKLTYEMLLTTPLSPTRILWGKLFSALIYVLLLIFAAIPLASLVFIFGGVAPMSMLRGLLVLIVVAAMLGTLGIFASAWLDRTARATVVSYLLVLLIFIGPFVAFVATGIARNDIPPRELLILNPVSALFSAILPPASTSVMQNNVIGGLGHVLAGNLSMMDGRVVDGELRPLYHYSLPLFAAITFVFYLLAAQMVKPTRRWRFGWRAVLSILLLVGLFAGAIGFGFWQTSDQYVTEPWNSEPEDEIIATPIPIREVAPKVEEEVEPDVAQTPTPEPDQE